LVICALLRAVGQGLARNSKLVVTRFGLGTASQSLETRDMLRRSILDARE